MKNNLRLVVITGVSAAGKTVLMEGLKATLPNVRFIQSVTTRIRRDSDSDADYEFLSPQEFEEAWANGEFITRVPLNGCHYAVRMARIKEAMSDVEHLYVRSLTPEVLEDWARAIPGGICYLHLDTPTREESIRRLTGSDRKMKMQEIEERFLKEGDWDSQIAVLREKGFLIHAVHSNSVEDTLRQALQIIR